MKGKRRSLSTVKTAVIDDRGTQRTVYYRYDKNGRLVEKKEDAGDKTLSVTAYTYDASDNLTGVTLPEGGKIFLIYDEAERLIYKLEREDRHHILRGIRYTYADFCPVSAEQLYGRQTTVREMNQLLIGMDSNALREFLNPEGADSEKLCQERATEQAYYQGKEALAVFHAFEKAYGNIENGDSHRYEKALKEGLCGEPDTGRESSSYNRHYVWDFRGNLLKQKDSLGSEWKYVYNLIGKIEKIIDPLENVQKYVYDEKGRLQAFFNGAGENEYRLKRDALGQILEEWDALGNKVSYTYDGNGRQTQVIGPDGNTERYTKYNIWGQILGITDGNGATTHYKRDIWGRITKVKYPDGTEEKYVYNYAGKVIRLIDALENTTILDYDAEGKLIRMKKADGGVQYFGRDHQGRCIFCKDENQNVTTFEWNMDDNLTMKKGYNENIKDSVITSLYTYSEDGRLVSASENGTVYQYTYDTEGRLLEKDAWGRTLLEKRYDKAGRLRKLIAQGHTACYIYDGAGRIATIKTDVGGEVNYNYNLAGKIESIHYGNGLTSRYQYDEKNQITSLRSGIQDKIPIMQADYQYDGNGNRICKIEKTQNKQKTTISYSYDCLGRLQKEQSNEYYCNYKYDSAGNRISAEIKNKDQIVQEKYFYNERNQLVNKQIYNAKEVQESVDYEYDPSGNLVRENRTKNRQNIIYQYDVYGRNISIDSQGDSPEYNYIQMNHYDAEGLRYELEEKTDTENKKKVFFTYHNGNLVEETDETGKTLATYGIGNEYVFLERKRDIHYYITDEQGSVRYVVNSSGSIENEYGYNAFGDMHFCNETISNRLRYNAQIMDELTGDYYLRARYYRPSVGRFLQEDVIYDDGLNLYAYCGSNPIMYCDPSGFKSKRKKYMGSTPSKNSRVGKQTIQYMDSLGMIKWNSNHTKALQFQSITDGLWYSISDADMSHKNSTFEKKLYETYGKVEAGHVDAVVYWNTKGKYTGARSKEVREYMTNPDNYYLELNSYNRSEGAKLGIRYDDPEPQNKNNLCKKK